MRPRRREADWGRHVDRELNFAGDTLANWPDERVMLYVHPASEFCGFRLCFDGSCSPTKSGIGWILQAVSKPLEISAWTDLCENWQVVAEGSFTLPVHTSAIDAEVAALSHGLDFFSAGLARTCLDFIAAGARPRVPARNFWMPRDVQHISSL